MRWPLVHDLRYPLRLRWHGGLSLSPSILFPASVLSEGVDDSAVIMTVRSATVGEPYDITVSSDGGGTPVTASGTVSAASFTETLDLTGLNSGTLTASYEENSVEVATRLATLVAAGVGRPFGLLLALTKAA